MCDGLARIVHNRKEYNLRKIRKKYISNQSLKSKLKVDKVEVVTSAQCILCFRQWCMCPACELNYGPQSWERKIN